MQFEDILTLRTSLTVETSEDTVRWSGEKGSLEIRRIGARWYGPIVDWSGSKSTCREAVRGVVEAVLDRTDDEVVIEVEPAAVEGWDPASLGFNLAWARKKPGVWQFCRSETFGGTEAAFEGLVVSLSGGGVRATAFSLGVFSVLDELGLLPSVRCVTAVSGGAMFAGAWTAARASNLTFAECHDRLLDFLTGQRDHDEHRPVGATLIRRYADLLSLHLFGSGEDGEWTLGSIPSKPEVVFQATELTRAGSFVFAASPSVAQGSPGKVVLPRALANDVRLADAVAASAAFPVGFEPFVFPRDFALPEPTKRAVVGCIHEARSKGRWPVDSRDAIPLVDGGVFDNQGVHAALNAARRHGDDADLLLLADVAITDPARAVWVPGQLEPDASVLAGLTAAMALLLTVGWLLTSLVPLWGAALLVMLTFLVFALLFPTFVVERLRRVLPPDLSMVGFRTPTGFIHAVGLRLQIAVVLLKDVFLERLRSVRYAALFDNDVDLVPAFVRIEDVERMRSAPEGSILAALRERHPLTEEATEEARVATAVPTVLHLSGTAAERRATLQAVVNTGRRITLLKLLLTILRSRRPRTASLRALRDQIGVLLNDPSPVGDVATPAPSPEQASPVEA